MLGAASATYRAGAMVFGGGHVVLPLLQTPFVAHEWLTESTVLTGYSLAQAVPGPLFTMAAFLGAAMATSMGCGASLVAGFSALLTVAAFLPGLLFVAAAVPAWHTLRRRQGARAALAGAGAAVVGVLGAAFAQPIIPSGIRDGSSLVIALGCVVLLAIPRMPTLVVVLAGALAGHFVLAP
jgi:chromate transporter